MNEFLITERPIYKDGDEKDFIAKLILATPISSRDVHKEYFDFIGQTEVSNDTRDIGTINILLLFSKNGKLLPVIRGYNKKDINSLNIFSCVGQEFKIKLYDFGRDKLE